MKSILKIVVLFATVAIYFAALFKSDVDSTTATQKWNTEFISQKTKHEQIAKPQSFEFAVNFSKNNSFESGVNFDFHDSKQHLAWLDLQLDFILNHSIKRSKNLAVRIRKQDAIFPFHYFW